MIEESETPDMGSQSDATADALAARRARREQDGDPVVIRRAEAAEAAVRNLETHLAALEQRLEEVGQERERVAQQLKERESDVRNVKQREYAEQQLRVEAEDRGERLQREMRTQIQDLASRLDETERQAHELGVELEDVRRELSEAQQALALNQRIHERGEELRERMVALEGRVADMQRDIGVEHEAREQAERELADLRERDARLAPIVAELIEVAAELRAGFERELAALREELQRQVVWERETYVRELTAMGARMEDLRFELARTAADLRAQLSAEPLDAALLQPTTPPQSEREAAHRREMADALVAAVDRLRARVAEVKDAETAEADVQAETAAPVEPPAVEAEAVVPVESPPVQTEAVASVEPPAVESPAVQAEAVAPVEPPAVEPPAVQTEAVAPVEPAVQPKVETVQPAEEETAQAPQPDVAWTPREQTAGSGEPTIAFKPSPFITEMPPEAPPLEKEPVVEFPDEDVPVFESSAEQSVVVEPPVEETPVFEAPVEEPVVDVPVVDEPAVLEPVVEEPPAEERPAEEPAVVAEESAVEEEPAVEEESAVEEDPRAGGLAAPIAPADRLAPVEAPFPSLGPNGSASTKATPSGPVALQSRPLSVPEKRISWFAPAIRKLAAERDAKLAAELVIELIPAQRESVDGPLNYEIKIGELGTFYVTLDPGQATISREPRGSVDFSLEGPVAAFSELAAGGTSRRHPGLRIRKGKRSARRFLKTRRKPIALADLASAGVDVWPGLLLLAMAEAIDPEWTTGRRFELAFEIKDTSDVVIYVRVSGGEAILVSRTAAGQPVATISLSGHALICLLAGTQAPAGHTVLVTGDATSVDTFLQWTARAQGLTVAGA